MQPQSNIADERVVVVYERVSTDRQDLTRQAVQRERAAADYPAREIVVIQDDGVSAYKVPIFERPGGKRLCSLIETGQVEALYADAQDRLSRGRQSEWWNFADLCEQGETRIVIDGRELRLGEEGDEIRSAIDQIIARRESREKSHRIAGVFRTAAAQGRKTGGRDPFGYRSTGSGKARVFTIDAAEAEVVRRIFAEYLSGRGFAAIARGLNADGLRTRDRVSWRARTVGKIVGNPFDTGLVRHKDETFEGSHPAIIDRETFERTEALRTARVSGPGRGRGRHSLRHLLSGGLLRCGRCGGSMSPRGGKSDNYRCAKRTAGGDCDQPSVSRRKIDNAVLGYFLHARHDYEATIEQATSEAQRQVEEAEALLAEAERQVAKAEEGRDRAVRAFLDGKIGDDAYALALDRATSEQQAAEAEARQLRQRLEDAEAALDAIDGEGGVVEGIAALREAVAGEVASAEGIEAARAALTGLFESFTVECNDDGLRIIPTLRTRSERQGRRKAPLAIGGNRPVPFG